MTIGQFLTEAAEQLRDTSSTPELDAQVLAAYGLDRTKSYLHTHIYEDLSGKRRARLNDLLHRRMSGLPVAYLTGYTEFYGLELSVSPAVMIPRPESELLVETAVSAATHGGRVLDAGTGSGALAIALKHARPDLEVNACDDCSRALRVARGNARKQRTDVAFSRSNLLGVYHGSAFDTVVANLPYLPIGSDVSRSTVFEPERALYSGFDGLDCYRQLFAELSELRELPHHLLIECLPTQTESLTRLGHATGFARITALSDFVLYFRDPRSQTLPARR